MATTKNTPTTEPFPPLETAPRTSTSTSSGAQPPHTSRPHSAQKDLAFGKSPKRGLLPGAATALPLTGAAAMAEMKRRAQQSQQPDQAPQNGVGLGSRHTSPNPAQIAMASLMGGGGMSRPTDAPAPDKLSEPLRKAAEKIDVPESISEMDDPEVSPVSLGSFGTMESGGTGNGMTATANDHAQFTAEPAQMTDGTSYSSNHGQSGNGSHLAVAGEDGNKAFSYPGPPPQSHDQEDGQTPQGARGMSLPGYGQQSSPKSPASSNKRHKCPYCATDFTRHHNLKSHLLTHSQEKPYVCQTCAARFRRLHDLKRHTKLHTGERPHKCNQCEREFARGDALARHKKGPGGCAGRRSSFGGDNEYGDGGGPDGMDGVEYDEDGEQGNEQQQPRRISEPNRKRQQLETPQDTNREVYRQHSSTYPPAPTRSMQGSMGPPQVSSNEHHNEHCSNNVRALVANRMCFKVIHPGSSSTATSPREMPNQQSPGPGSYYSQGQMFAEPGMMTSSPKPLSPGQPQDQHRLSVGDGTGPGQLGRNRSTSLTQQFQQAHFGRGSTSSARTPPPPHQFALQQQGAQHNILPPLGASSQPSQRGSVQPTALSGGPMTNMQGHQQQQLPMATGLSSNPGSHSSHGRSSGSSMRDLAGQDPADIWAYVRQLESRFTRMQDEYELRIGRLQEEVISLKGQVGNISNPASYSSDMGQRGPYPG